MGNSMPNPINVLIVGAGPTGLMMGIELQRNQIPFRIIDKQIKPVSTSNALAMQTRTLEVFDDIELLTTALAVGTQIKGGTFYEKNITITSLDFSLLDSLYHFGLAISQSETETILQEYLQQQNIRIEMEVELINFNEDEKTIHAILRHKDGTIENIETDWLIACDGGHSLIRQKLQLPFEGKELEQHFILADINTSSELNTNQISLFFSDTGPTIVIPYDKNAVRIIVEVTHSPELHNAKSLSVDQLENLLKKDCPISLKINQLIWSSGFWIHERLISNFQHHRVFFAGDAAHIHSPAGGQGMNTGIQDAYNLAWKLALCIKGHANESLLTSYNEERHGVAKKLLKNTTALTTIMTLHNFLLKKIRNILFHYLMKFKKIRKKAAMLISELAINYEEGPITKDCVKTQPGPSAGSRFIDVKFNNQRLLDEVRGINFCLLIFSGKDTLDCVELINFKNILKQRYKHLMKYLFISPNQDNLTNWDEQKILDQNLIIHEQYHITFPTLYLIRPDKYIGFRGRITQQKELLAYLDTLLTLRT